MFTGILLPVFITVFYLRLFPQSEADTVRPFMSKQANSLRPTRTVACASLLKSMRRCGPTPPVKPSRNMSLLYLCILLMSLSPDVEKNPGPQYPWGSCDIEVRDNDPALECDSCTTVKPLLIVRH
ncbi:hypothetical protein DPMN_178402 [Dreissena polymorpha]|uniref:Uncharacterized protein n=1 Tax=Dreissena polymorpha TaxID=45954 RepID=A0A9D4ECU1_DREPO|nr:hypothetical protein DPMN_178402 [Dreissena polymorpha]